MKRLLLVLSAVILGGCASKPTLTYHKIDSQKKAGALTEKISDSYYLNTTLITITPQEQKDPQKPGPLTYSVSAEPVEARNFKVGIEPKNSIFSTTKINIVKVENTDRYSSGGSETIENLKATISTVGGLIVKAIGLGGSAPGPRNTTSCTKALTSPFKIDVSEFLTHKPEIIPYNFVQDDQNTRCVTLEVFDLPPDAMPVESYPWGIETSNYYYSACREIKLTIAYPNNERVLVKSFRIADPHYVQAVRYPYKGSITMHPQCGVSVKTDSMPNPNYGLEVAGELLKQIDDIKNAK